MVLLIAGMGGDALLTEILFLRFPSGVLLEFAGWPPYFRRFFLGGGGGPFRP